MELHSFVTITKLPSISRYDILLNYELWKDDIKW